MVQCLSRCVCVFASSGMFLGIDRCCSVVWLKIFRSLRIVLFSISFLLALRISILEWVDRHRRRCVSPYLSLRFEFYSKKK